MIRRVISSIWTWIREAIAFAFSTPSRVTVIVCAFCVGFAASAPVSDGAYNYMWANPTFCGTCHIHDYADAAFFRSAHAGVTTCHDCHRVPLMHYPPQAYNTIRYGALTQWEMPKPNVPSVLCETCHTDDEHEAMTGPMSNEMRAQVVKIDQSPLHRIHLDAKRRNPGPAKGGPHEGAPGAPTVADDVLRKGETSLITCMDCHGSQNNRAHHFLPSRANCIQCHSDADKAGGRLKTLQCQECHFDGFVGRKPGFE